MKTPPFLTAWLVCFLVMELCGAGWVTGGEAAKFDFRSFYAAGYLMRTHPSQLYNPARQDQVQSSLVAPGVLLLAFLHPSYETLMYAPFSLLRYRTAYLAFIAFNMLLLLATLFAMRSLSLQRPIPHSSRSWVMTLLFLPLLIAIAHGQDSVLLLLLCCLAFRQLEGDRDLSAGALLGLALFEFQIVLPLAALLAIRCGWRFFSGFVAAAAGVALLCIAILGPAGIMDYVHLLYDTAQPSEIIYPSGMTNLAGLLYGCGLRFLSSRLVFNPLVDTFSLGIFVWSALAVRRVELRVAFSIAVLCALMVSYHLFIYDLALVLLPATLLTQRTQRYTFLVIFFLPIILLLFFQATWFFLVAVPVLVMLVNAILFNQGSATLALSARPATPASQTAEERMVR